MKSNEPHVSIKGCVVPYSQQGAAGTVAVDDLTIRVRPFVQWVCYSRPSRRHLVLLHPRPHLHHHPPRHHHHRLPLHPLFEYYYRLYSIK